MAFVPPDPLTTEWVPIWNPVSEGPAGPAGPAGPPGTGSGDVTGPAGATVDRLATYADTTGKLIKDSGIGAANVALLNAANTFTQDQTISKLVPRLGLNDTTQPANARLFKLVVAGQVLNAFALDDASATVQATPIALYRNGDARVGADVYEKGRTVPMGHWADVPFSAANFSGSAPLTWTVTAGQIAVNRISLVGKTLFWRCNVEASTLGGTTSGALFLVLPSGLVANGAGTSMVRLQNSGWQVGQVSWVDGGNYLNLSRPDFSNYVTPDTLLYVRMNLTIEVR